MDPKLIQAEWPMPSYMNAWRVFRNASNENFKTAQHIVECDQWPVKGQSISIVDIGCGDGLLVSEVATLSPSEIKTIRLVEPNREFLKQAVKNCEGKAQRVESICSTFMGSADSCLKNADAVIAAHLVYLLPEGELECILKRLPTQVPLYVVLDHENSIFSKLWAITAQKYLGRANHAREVIEKLSPRVWKVRKTTLTSEIGHPDGYSDTVSCHLYSLLCYTDVRDLPNEELDRIKRIVRNDLVAGNIRCKSVCYEMVKVGATAHI